MNSEAKIVFPSTHVVFEGLKEPKENLDENEKTETFLAYSSKRLKMKIKLSIQVKNTLFLDSDKFMDSQQILCV